MNGKQLIRCPSPTKRDGQRSNLKSKSNISDSERSNKAVDIARLLTRKQQSRESTINYHPHTYIYQQQRQIIRHSDYPSNFRISSFSMYEEEEKYSTYATKAAIRNMNMLDQSFLSTNQSSTIIGVLLYLLFIAFMVIEVIATSYVIPKHTSNSPFYFETALLTLLLSELCYYLLLRYLSSHTSQRIFLHKSAGTSFDRLMHLSKSLKSNPDQSTVSNWLLTKPYLLLTTIIAIVVICQLLYSTLATQVIFFWEQKSEGYMVSTLFWSNFALPYLFSNFYLNRPIEDRVAKVKWFLIVVIVYLMYSLVDGLLFFSLMVFNLLHTLIHSKKEFDHLHINQLIKLMLLCGIMLWMMIKYLFITDETIKEAMVFIGTLLFHVLMVAISMFLTRVIAVRYLKQQLYKHFYTETGINIAFIAAAFIMNLMNLDQYHRKQPPIVIDAVINLAFLGVIGVIIHLEGKDKLLVIITSDPFQQQNY